MLAMDYVGILGALSFAFIWASRLRQANIRQKIPWGTFGSEAVAAAPGGPEQWASVFAAFLSQQRHAYGLLWFSIGIGIVAGGSLLAKTISTSELDLGTLVAAASIAGDIWLGRYAWRLYESASKRLENLMLQPAIMLPTNGEGRETNQGMGAITGRR